jgi:uncharacterized membrane protein YkoI
MKKWMLSLSILLGGTLVSCGQDFRAKDVPSIVKNAFQAKFVKAVDVDWEKKGADYEVAFELNKADYKALLDEFGTLKMYKQELSAHKLPGEIRNAIRTKYKSYRIDEAELLKISGVSYYQIDLDGRLPDVKIVFAADGQEMETISYWK